MNDIDKEVRKTPAGYPTMPGYRPAGQGTAPMPTYPPVNQEQYPGTYDVSQFEQAYAGPSAEAVDRGQVTFDDIIVRTGMMFGVLLVAAVAGWVATAANQGLGVTLMGVGMIVGLILVIVNSVKKEPSPPLMMAYAAAEGLVLGALSAFLEAVYPGIVVQAVLATFVVFAVTLVLYRMKVLRSSPKMQRVLMLGLISLLVYYGISMLLQAAHVISSPLGTVTVFGIPLGILVGLIAVVLAVMSLVSDFDVAERCVAAGMPRSIAWSCAFGLIVTLVWLYTEILRILQYLRIFSN
ncbi:MAG: Bax inhibitor-1/YccA family protein [Actinomycetaceae bacterium]|nr:Bax inhibitor-1/YccA family protein [Actinomycetaceae bacterium]MDU0970699.1 Bax inhibitor-1/YccA family protein [Actinomycetaceae bacterium]